MIPACSDYRKETCEGESLEAWKLPRTQGGIFVRQVRWYLDLHSYSKKLNKSSEYVPGYKFVPFKSRLLHSNLVLKLGMSELLNCLTCCEGLERPLESYWNERQDYLCFWGWIVRSCLFAASFHYVFANKWPTTHQNKHRAILTKPTDSWGPSDHSHSMFVL